MSQFAEEEKKQKTNVKPAAVQKEPVQRELSDVNGPEGGILPESVSARIQSKRGSGQRLSDRQLKNYSEKFGRDMSDVHIHTDAESDTISRSLNARAFTIGSDVFLTKGINPDGSGRDAQTMTHELTHVAQQGGHASSGRLRLGAADTAQEHEAESTARREFEPDSEAKDTVQRGFLSDIVSSVGAGLMEGIGLGDAFQNFMSGDMKVKEAINKLSEEEQEKFKSLDADIKSIGDQVKEADNEESEEYTAIYDEYEDALEMQLELVKKADPSVTEADMDRYRSGKGTVLVSSLLGTIGGSFRAGFERDPKKKEEIRKQTISNIGSGIAGRSRLKDKRETDQKYKRNVIKSVWRDVQKNEDLRSKYKGWIPFRSEMEKNYSDLIRQAMEKGQTEDKVKAGILGLIETKADKAGSDAAPAAETAKPAEA